VDRLLNAARTSTDMDERRAIYAEAQAILSVDLPIIYLYHQTWLWALRGNVSGFEGYPDGMIRLAGVRVN
jgi:peptide/nickel transport system substrate-binding protein